VQGPLAGHCAAKGCRPPREEHLEEDVLDDGEAAGQEEQVVKEHDAEDQPEHHGEGYSWERKRRTKPRRPPDEKSSPRKRRRASRSSG
jgi:hypothetical protein